MKPLLMVPQAMRVRSGLAGGDRDMTALVNADGDISRVAFPAGNEAARQGGPVGGTF